VSKKLKIYRTTDKAVIPKYATEQSSCFDLHACWNGPVKVWNAYSNSDTEREPQDVLILNPGDRALVPTGLIFDIPKGHSVRTHPRSGMALKNGMTLINCTGVIDSDYVQETFVPIINLTEAQSSIKFGDRIAQAEMVKDLKVSFEEVENAPGDKTDRTGGLGSTGV